MIDFKESMTNKSGNIYYMKKIITIIAIFSLTLFNSCDQSNAQLFDLILEIKSQNDQLLNEVKTLQLKSDLLIAELRLSAAKQEELLIKVTDLQNELSSILSQIALINKQLENQSTDVQVVKDKLAELQTQYQGIVVQLQELQKLSQVLAEIEKMKTQFTQLDKRYITILAGLVQNKQELDAFKTQIATIQTQLANNLTKLGLLTSQLGDQDVIIGNILKQIELIKNNNAELIKLLESLLSGKSPIPTDGLIGWWPFNGNTNDESGNGNNGVVFGATLTNGRNGLTNLAYSFSNGSNLIATTKQYSSPNSLSYSVWFKTNTSTSFSQIIGFNDGKNSHGFYWDRVLYIKNNKLGYYTFNPSTFQEVDVNVIDNEWHHCAVTMDQLGSSIYLDGKLLSSRSSQNTGQSYSGYFRIGGLSPNDLNNSMIGSYDDIAIWNRALSASEVTKIYLGQGF